MTQKLIIIWENKLVEYNQYVGVVSVLDTDMYQTPEHTFDQICRCFRDYCKLYTNLV